MPKLFLGDLFDDFKLYYWCEGGRITFEVGGYYATFCFVDEKIVSLNSFLSDVLSLSPELEMEDGWSCPIPSDFDWILTEDPNQEYVKVEFATSMLPSIPEVETYASNESFMSDYCRFTQLILSLPLMKGVNLDFDLGIEYDDNGPSDRGDYLFVLYADGMLWCNLIMKKDL